MEIPPESGRSIPIPCPQGSFARAADSHLLSTKNCSLILLPARKTISLYFVVVSSPKETLIRDDLGSILDIPTSTET